eukprot:Lithocolla_globosa_v1_NODE_3548_length_1641_cov_3.305801.p1 type:complete len:197 gc:universal NODE_3548_length_1641_cov_3.305801:979-1569(+)
MLCLIVQIGNSTRWWSMSSWLIQCGDCIDAFAGPDNNVFPVYWFAADDAFGQDWTNKTLWVNPPFDLLKETLKKITNDKPRISLVVHPLWPTAPWYDTLIDLSGAGNILRLGKSPDLFLPASMKHRTPVGEASFDTQVAVVKYPETADILSVKKKKHADDSPTFHQAIKGPYADEFLAAMKKHLEILEERKRVFAV